MGAELEKGRNLWAETSGGQIRKGPKPLATPVGPPYWITASCNYVKFNKGTLILHRRQLINV